LLPDRITERWAETEKLLVVHKPDPEKSRGQYLDLLRISVEENPTEPRNAFYYARELSFRSMWREAIVEAQRYLELPRANWPNERCYAMRVIGRSYQEIGDWDKALKWLRDACSEAPATREPWHDLALACYRTSRWAEALGASLTCLSITHREKLYTVDPAVWGSAPHDLAAIAAWNLGQHALALEHAEKAVELAPDDLRLRRNLEFCQNSTVAA
jgi:tetratricopeptide (TPR) repeat protein